MSVIMRLFGTANGQATPYDGQYLEAFDFEANDGVGEITMTPYPSQAKRFRDLGEAHTFYKTVPTCKPIRWDGRPNRPLTSTNWQFETVDD